MKHLTIIAVLLAGTLGSCTNLDMYPLDQPSSETWLETPEQVEQSLNTMLLHMFWPQEKNEFAADKNIMCMDEPTDDWTNRTTLIAFTNGTLNGDNSTAVKQMWFNTYKGIARVNTIINGLHKVRDLVTQQEYDRYEANARFYRACFYSRLIQLFGDVVYFTDDIPLEEAFHATRTDKKIVLGHIYEDFDFAIRHLPVKYSGSEVERATKGAAYAMKARVALFFYDYTTARDAANGCISLGAYTLHSDFGELFLNKTHHSPEAVFCIPRSMALAGDKSIAPMQYRNGGSITAYLPRLAGSGVGATACPSWDLFCAFLCSDGLAIDKSPLYNPQKPFENRDPRCTATIVEFGTRHLNVILQPHFDSLTVWSFKDNKQISNEDNRRVNQYASYNGLMLKKGIDNDWIDDFCADPDKLIMRYADVLLIYAEAMIELGTIDDSVLTAMNTVRARAYKVDVGSDQYPRITTTNQAALRTILRTERRMEFAFEGLRIYDLYRWRIAEKVMNRCNYGFSTDKARMDKIIKDKKWFFPGTPKIDEDGCPDFTTIPDLLTYATKLSTRVFDATEGKNYLWPIPTDDYLATGGSIGQNPGY